jgi:hypothetical protein
MDLCDNLDTDYTMSQLMDGMRIDDINNKQAKIQHNPNMPTKGRHFHPPFMKYGYPKSENLYTLATRAGVATGVDPEVMATDITLSQNKALVKKSLIPFI